MGEQVLHLVFQSPHHSPHFHSLHIYLYEENAYIEMHVPGA